MVLHLQLSKVWSLRSITRSTALLACLPEDQVGTLPALTAGPALRVLGRLAVEEEAVRVCSRNCRLPSAAEADHLLQEKANTPLSMARWTHNWSSTVRLYRGGRGGQVGGAW